MKMTPLDIQNQQFSVRMRGFDVREVDAFLDLMAETFETMLSDSERLKAEKIIQRAHNRLAQLHEDIDELKRQRMQIELQIQAVIDNHARMLEMTREDMRTVDDEDAKVKVLK